MYEKKILKSFNCPIEVTREVIGGKWKPSIICYLRRGMKRPSELRKAIPDASIRVLNLQLRELEMNGIIEKKIFHEMPPKVEYALTDVGKSLFPIIDIMEQWGEQYKVTVGEYKLRTASNVEHLVDL